MACTNYLILWQNYLSIFPIWYIDLFFHWSKLNIMIFKVKVEKHIHCLVYCQSAKVFNFKWNSNLLNQRVWPHRPQPPRRNHRKKCNLPDNNELWNSLGITGEMNKDPRSTVKYVRLFEANYSQYLISRRDKGEGGREVEPRRRKL